SAPYHNDVGGVRGNQTETRVHQFSPGVDTWLVSKRIYDTLGNLRQTIDPLQHNTFYSYDDSLAASDCAPSGLGKGFVTEVKNHLGHRVQTDYFPCTGMVKNTKDENDILAGGTGTSHTYELMGRHKVETRPAGGGSTTFDYDDTRLVVTRSTEIGGGV